MGAIKTTLMWTNPLTYIIGAPVLAGIVLSAIFYGVGRRTAKIIEEIDMD